MVCQDRTRVKGSLQKSLLENRAENTPTNISMIIYNKPHPWYNILLKMCLLVSVAVKVINYG